MTDRGLLLIVSGPSGVGKTTIARHIETQLNGAFSVSMTTRSKTAGDKVGIDYHFVQKQEFEKLIKQGAFLEWAHVFGNLYGTPRGPVVEALAQGRLVILEIDVQGAIQVKGHMPQAFAIFISPPSEQTLLQRLRDRGRDDEANMQKRFAEARRERGKAQSSGVYDAFMVNDQLRVARDQAIAIVRRRLAHVACKEL